VTAAGEQPTGSPGTADYDVFPRRDHSWRAGDIVAVGVAALAVAVAFEREWAWLLFVLGAGAAIVAFAVYTFRSGDDYLLLVDDAGLSKLSRNGEVERFTAWSSILRVEFSSGIRFPTTDASLARPTITWRADGPHDRWKPSDIAARLEVSILGRRAVEDLERTLRAACDAHGVPFEAEWSWGWWLRRRTIRRRERATMEESV
jgi:hypothetical protein